MHAAVFLLLALLPQSQKASKHAIAIVNDARSHGTVGDTFLSLNEVIQLCNNTLMEDRLSPAERAQIRGEGEPSSVHVDALTVPVLRMERQLDEVADSIHGFFLEGLNGVPTIDFTGTRGLVTRNRTQSFGRLRLTGGDYAIDSVADHAHHTSWVYDLECVGQRVAGVRLVSRGAAAYWRLIVTDCTFVDSTLELVDEAPGGTGLLELERINVFGPGGIDLLLGAPGAVDLFLTRIACETGGVSIRRSADGHARSLRLQATHLIGTHFVVEGSPIATTLVEIADLALSERLELGAHGGLEGTLQEFRLEGDALIRAVPAPGLTLRNGCCDHGRLDIEGPALLERCRLSHTDIRGAGGSVEFRDSDLLGGSVTVTGGTLLLTDCHLAGSMRDPRVQVVAPRAEAWHGTIDVLPVIPRLGGVLEFHSLLPPGRLGLWCFGLTQDTPTAGPGQTRLYLDINAMAVLPSVLRGRGSFDVPIPLDPALRSTDAFVQVIVLRDAAQGPELLTPPGRRLVFR